MDELVVMYVSVEKRVCFTVVWVLLFYIESWWWASLLLVRLRRRQTGGMVTQAHEWWGKPLLYLKSCCVFFSCAALVAKSPPGISFAQWNFIHGSALSTSGGASGPKAAARNWCLHFQPHGARLFCCARTSYAAISELPSFENFLFLHQHIPFLSPFSTNMPQRSDHATALSRRRQ